MLAGFGSLERHPGTTVESVAGGEVTLSDGTRLATDILLWGTGYETDLSYFDDARIASIRNVGELGARCACHFRSLDAPDLYFSSVGLDGIGALSWSYALVARSVMSHIRGTARLDMWSTAWARFRRRIALRLCIGLSLGTTGDSALGRGAAAPFASLRREGASAATALAPSPRTACAPCGPARVRTSRRTPRPAADRAPASA